MELFRVGVQYVSRSLRDLFYHRLRRRHCGNGAFSRRSSRRSCRTALAALCSIRLVVARGIVDSYTRLDIVGEHTEQNAISVILNGLSFHQNAFGNEVVAIEHRRDSV